MQQIQDQDVFLGKCIAVPESRELNLFADMLSARGASVLRCPLIAIHDTPHKELVEKWLGRLVASEFDDLILLTGEGLRRLLSFAEAMGDDRREGLIAALGGMRKIVRGPKPANALRKLGMKADLSATTPTTDGVIDALSREALEGRKVAVQLYGEEPNLKLVSFLEGRGAEVFTVAPYVYADDAEVAQVLELIDAVIGGGVDAIAFTSTPQLKRLLQVARRNHVEAELVARLNQILVAAVGPVMARALEEQGITVGVVPESTYFMKPMVRQMALAFEGRAKPS